MPGFFFQRDLSWLSFNDRVLMEAEDPTVPLLERINFLAIFSSNLDEFFRVRMPALIALDKLGKKNKLKNTDIHLGVAKQAAFIIDQQQDRFGAVLRSLVPQLEQNGIRFLYDKPVPFEIMPELSHYFFTQVLTFLQPVPIISGDSRFDPVNNQLYLAAQSVPAAGENPLTVIHIPSDHLPRFFSVKFLDHQYIVFLEDIIRLHLPFIPGLAGAECHSFKITRDAELHLEDDYTEDVAELIEKKIAKRNDGLATRFLYEPGMPKDVIKKINEYLGLRDAVCMEGGKYHNLKDLASLIVPAPALKYPSLSPIQHAAGRTISLLDHLKSHEVLLHTPYHSYDTVLRFFNEAAIASDVEEIYITMYRVASESRIVNALISAARNGKKVTVLVELKARFDEANNIKWAKRLKRAGVNVLYTPNHLKVHAKVALVTRRKENVRYFVGLLATGNLNETTARFYTDHILMTSNAVLLKEVETVFQSFTGTGNKKKKENFKHLLVAQHNLLEKFLALIDREISHAQSGLPARILIKLNNLEEKVLIQKLYEASNAGVKIQLIVRSICCIVPGVAGMSENISVRRIVDRYLEHGRVYVFHNNGDEQVFLGSADWMNRNIYRRIEVCFPLYDAQLQQEILAQLQLQLQDNEKAVTIDSNLGNVRKSSGTEPVRSQLAIYEMLQMR